MSLTSKKQKCLRYLLRYKQYYVRHRDIYFFSPEKKNNKLDTWRDIKHSH